MSQVTDLDAEPYGLCKFVNEWTPAARTLAELMCRIRSLIRADSESIFSWLSAPLGAFDARKQQRPALPQAV